MANGRFVSRSISTNEQLGAVSIEADFLFGRCIPHLDRDGRITGNPALLAATVAPLRAELTPHCVAGLLEELASAVDADGVPLVLWYEVAGQRVLAFPGFSRQQQGMKYDREAASRFPAPNDPRARHLAGPGLTSAATPTTPPGTAAPGSGSTPEEVRTRSGLSGSGIEVEVQAEAKRAHEAGPGRTSAATAAPSLSHSQTHSRSLAELRTTWLEHFYGSATEARRIEVEGQLDALLSSAGCPHGRKGHRRQIRATETSLAAALRATLTEGVRNSDRAIVVVLLKCEEGPANLGLDDKGRTPTDAAKEDGARQRAAEERDGEARRAAALAWLDEHPEEAAEIARQAELEVPGDGEVSWVQLAREMCTVRLVERMRAELAEVGA